MSSPPRTMQPSSAMKPPVMALNRVDLPAPLEPTMVAKLALFQGQVDAVQRHLFVHGARVEGLADTLHFQHQHQDCLLFAVGLGVAEAGLLLALFKGDLLADGGHRDGHRHDQGRDQLHGCGGHVEPQGHRHDETVQAAAKDHAAHPQDHRALAQQGLANDEGGQGDGHHAGAHVECRSSSGTGPAGAGQGGSGCPRCTGPP